ncbi:hypothetical protein AKJ65_03270 [candidate division MSBL1 archaeon SCGC-AAA259E19]|uniref:Uncharacterized protein n=1 Tax=candidate division MSBL1 archaeon SCGC-AAA259E19 TaxID=1698264 RepID=A0A133UKY9_9EURY|nr:hypothetical protein AKJ65_03270 [candidate division MSBL1 archaeon SCGC-AAA259E19]
MKVRVKQTFQHENERFEEGTVTDLPDSVAEQAIEKDYAEKAEEEGEEKEEEMPKLEPSEETEEAPEVEEQETEVTGGEKAAEKTKETEEPGDVFGEMEKKLDEEPENPPTWSPPRKDAPDPDEVDDLKGRVQRISRNVGRNENDVIAVRTPEGETLSLWKKVALEDLFDVVEVGDYIAVRYTGTETGSSGRTYLTYRYVLYDEDRNLKVSG